MLDFSISRTNRGCKSFRLSSNIHFALQTLAQEFLEPENSTNVNVPVRLVFDKYIDVAVRPQLVAGRRAE